MISAVVRATFAILILSAALNAQSDSGPSTTPSTAPQASTAPSRTEGAHEISRAPTDAVAQATCAERCRNTTIMKRDACAQAHRGPMKDRCIGDLQKEVSSCMDACR